MEAPGGDKRSDKGSSGSGDLLDTAARAPALTQAQLETRHALHTAALARAQAELKDFLGAVCLDHKAQTFHDYGVHTKKARGGREEDKSKRAWCGSPSDFHGPEEAGRGLWRD